MSDFTYSATGIIQISGCPTFSVSICINYKYAEGSVVYICDKAAKGCLEKVAIKSVRLVGIQKTPMYVDTFNAIYGESDLCTPEDAIEAATAFYNAKLAAALEASRCK